MFEFSSNCDILPPIILILFYYDNTTFDNPRVSSQPNAFESAEQLFQHETKFSPFVRKKGTEIDFVLTHKRYYTYSVLKLQYQN